MLEISVIIPTYNRCDSVVRLLHSLKKEVNGNVEIIIVEQGVNNKSMYDNIITNAKLKYIFEDIKSTSRAKNMGAKSAKGKILLFLDDDVIVSKDLLIHHLKNYEDSNIGGIAGRTITLGQENEVNIKDVGRISYFGNFSDGYSSNIRQEVDTVIGCNASWRRDLFEKVGGFDPNYTGNAMREESDLSLKIKKLGFHIIFDPTAEVTHVRAVSGGNRKTEGRLKWYFDFFSNETYFFLKYRNKYFLPVMLLNRTEYALRCMFGFGREVSFQSVLTPLLGVLDGVKKYKKYKNENRS